MVLFKCYLNSGMDLVFILVICSEVNSRSYIPDTIIKVLMHLSSLDASVKAAG